MKYFKIWMAFWVLFSCCCGNLMAQNAGDVQMQAAVYDEKGAPVSGAAISGNEGKTIVYSDAAGKFAISLPYNSPLLVSAKGFTAQTLRAGALPGRIVLASEKNADLVHLPFRKVERQDAPGAISVLNPETYIDRDYNFSVEAGINGRVPGLLWSNNIWGMENAIVLIDGVRREYSDITLNEVQQITVLKGGNAVALFGSQAAKGAILITTKKGVANTRKIGVRVNTGVATPAALPQYLNSAEYMTLYNEARRNDGLPDLFDAATIQNYGSGSKYRYANVDFYSSEYLKKYQHATDANAEFSGGNNNARFYSNIGWYNGGTLLNVGEGKNEGDNRFNVRGNVDLKLNDFISSAVYVSAVFNDSRRGRTNYWNSAATLLPHRVTPLIPTDLIAPGATVSLDLVKSSRNIIDNQYLLGGTQQFQTNPLADLLVGGYDKFIRRTFQVTNTIDFDLDRVAKGLSFHTLFNLDYANSYTQSISNTYAIYAPTWSATGDSITGLQKFGNDNRPGTQNISNTTQRQLMGFSAWLAYERSVGDAHNFSGRLLGYGTSLKRDSIYQPLTNAHLGLQLGYNYKHRYWFDFSSAYVNSTRLPEGNRAAFSPTVSLGWLLSAENFLAGSKAVNYLKLSASAGLLNTDLDISGYYLYDNIYTRQGGFTWNDGVQAFNQSTTSLYGTSRDLSFPKRKELNATLEGSFFNNLLNLQTTFFSVAMDGLPTQRFSQYPNYFNSFIPYTNYNANQRKGFDVLLQVNKQVGNVALSLGATATYAKSEVTKRDELYLDAYQNRAGKPVDAVFGMVSNGFFADQNDIANSPRQLFSEVRPGDIKYVDQNGDNVIDQRDEVMIGRWVAPLTYGLNFTATYRNLNLFLLGTGTNGGNGMMSNDYFWVDGDNKYSEVVRDRWTEATKTTATFPRLSAQQNNNNFRSSDFWLYNTARFTMSKVQLTYNLGAGTLSRTFVKDLGVFVAGGNLFTLSNNRKIMELSLAGTPQFRNYNVGLRAKF